MRVSKIEIRPVFEAADFGGVLTPELAERESRRREKAARRNIRGILINPAANKAAICFDF
jgi:hypothetical protein